MRFEFIFYVLPHCTPEAVKHRWVWFPSGYNHVRTYCILYTVSASYRTSLYCHRSHQIRPDLHRIMVGCCMAAYRMHAAWSLMYAKKAGRISSLHLQHSVRTCVQSMSALRMCMQHQYYTCMMHGCMPTLQSLRIRIPGIHTLGRGDVIHLQRRRRYNLAPQSVHLQCRLILCNSLS